MRLGQGGVGWQIERMRADQRALLRRDLELVNGLLDEALPDWEWRRPKGGPSLWIQLAAGTTSTFAQVALRFGVEVIPGEVMSPTGMTGATCGSPLCRADAPRGDRPPPGPGPGRLRPSDATHRRPRSVVV